MATFVLVHPAWFGGWCWKKVSPLLHARGHAVHTPLTGLGERVHLARPEVGLDTHVDDVVNLLTYEDLHDVVLVGTSSGGVVITGVVDRVPERIGHLVYLDAFVPEDGQSMLDIIPPERRPVMEKLVQTEGHGWLLPRFAPAPWETFARESWRISDEADLRWMLARLAPTPLGISGIRSGVGILGLRRCRARTSAVSAGRTPASTGMQKRPAGGRAGATESWLLRTSRTSASHVTSPKCRSINRNAVAGSTSPATESTALPTA